MFNPNLVPGQELSNDDLYATFKCGNSGGMRKSNSTNSLIIISDHVKSIYDDRWIDGVLHYTGMGMVGDQSIDATQNKTLAKSGTNGVTVFLFEVFTNKVYTYVGIATLADKPYNETQNDQNGSPRLVWMFPLKCNDSKFTAPQSKLENIYQSNIKKAKRLDDDELYERAANQSNRPGNRIVSSTQYARSPWVSEYTKRLANGYCQLCHNKAPFNNSSGEPYLECHHVKWLSKGGMDTIDNTVALCPNCHRRMHVVNSKQDIKHIKNTRLKDV